MRFSRKGRSLANELVHFDRQGGEQPVKRFSAVGTKVPGIENLFTVGLAQKHITVKCRMVAEKWRDGNIPDHNWIQVTEKPIRRDRSNAFVIVCSFYNVIACFSHVQRNPVVDAVGQPKVITVIVGDKYGIKRRIVKQAINFRQGHLFLIQLKTYIKQYSCSASGNFNDIAADLVLTTMNNYAHHACRTFSISAVSVGRIEEKYWMISSRESA